MINEDDYDYVTDRNLRRKLDKAHLKLLAPSLPAALVKLFKKNKKL
jgi:5,10-methylene-tetrahydrofolate dehydrogenase/methenyl tetrahydrofolate cyclohydrolase